MKNFRKYVVVSVIATLIVLGLSLSTVNASSGLMFTLGGNNTANAADTNAAATTNEAATTNDTANLANVASTTNVSNVPNVNDDLTKDSIPQAGENDIYVVSAVGILAIVIGGVAYIKSKKYDM